MWNALKMSDERTWIRTHRPTYFGHRKSDLEGEAAKKARYDKASATKQATSRGRREQLDLVAFQTQRELNSDFIPHTPVPVTINNRLYITCSNPGCKLKCLERDWARRRTDSCKTRVTKSGPLSNVYNTRSYNGKSWYKQPGRSRSDRGRRSGDPDVPI